MLVKIEVGPYLNKHSKRSKVIHHLILVCRLCFANIPKNINEEVDTMGEISNYVQAFFSFLSSYLIFLYGEAPMITILTIFIIIDYVSGVLAAIMNKDLSSKIGYRGIIKKIFIFIIVVVAHFFDMILSTENIIRDTTVIFYLINELISILENTARAGVPIPQIIINAVKVIKEKSKRKK